MLAQESETAFIDLSADGTEPIKNLVHFLYNGNYFYDSSPAKCYNTHAQLFVLADKYDIPALAKVALGFFRICCKNRWNSLAFLDVVEFSYNLTLANDALKKEIASQGFLHATELTFDGIVADRFHRLSEEVPQFFYDMVYGHAHRSIGKKPIAK